LAKTSFNEATKMTKLVARSIPLWCLIAIGMLAQSALAADTLLINGHIYTGDTHKPWAEALALKGAEIEAVGSNAQMRSHRTADTRVIDLHGHTVVPGFVDAHTHMLFGALDALYGANLSTPEYSIDPAKNPELVVEKIREYAAKHPDDKVILGRTHFGTTPPRTPSYELLDRAVSDRPVVIHNTSEHSLWVNSRAIELAGLTDRPLADPSEERGVLRDVSGRPTGVLVEAAMEVMERAVLPLIPLEDKLARIKAAAHYFNSFGVTSIVNATGSLSEIELYGMLRDRGELTVRTRTAFGAVAVPHHLTPKFLADLETARQRYHDDWVSANLVKFFMDGASGPYPPRVYDPLEYRQLVIELDRRGFQLMSHALRPDSVRLVLDTYATLESAHGKRDRRLRIEHAGSVYNSDLERFKTIGVIASMQPSFCCGEGPRVPLPDMTIDDRWNTFEKLGAVLAFSSDWPCTDPPDPLVGIQQATTRQVWRSPDLDDFSGAGQNGGVTLPLVYAPEEKITVQQAVAAYTTGSAYAAFHDDRVGSLAPGKLADLAVLSKDIFSMTPETISTARVLMTMVGGKIVFGAAPTM
jgi:predicted amidohydrolase YtcJ